MPLAARLACGLVNRWATGRRGSGAVAILTLATTLKSRLVGVTAGFGVPSTLTWKGSSRTAPEIPAGVASTATT